MHPLIRKLAVSAALAMAAPFASATVLGFDDIVGPDGHAAMPVNYGGLDWSDAGMSVYTYEQAPFTPHSGQGRVTTDWTDNWPVASTIRFLSPTVFGGAWFAGYGDSSVRFDLYFGGELVASSASLQLSDVPAYLGGGWTGAIDTVVVASDFPASYVMDDLSFDSIAEVPEPGTLALMLAGLGLAGTVRRRAAQR
ncbi:PEP-CTERM sorting domain-containing protein [Massilia sp. IC2-278]|uniref:PEP-CTERM sorting domain-containing protein n=1 Tax=Massilia sp. IC2-278 TaxID=2887200 RepID=UPI001E5C42F0|nr:PEP-CTERM sorting domain-containing protein [Massilia sp. IC2-278]MCC2962685.1 PEP-CTERM sorting domain-containing protein [Massilia sp. IC2-278]